MTTKKLDAKPSHRRKGAHHRHSKPYLKVYWPYVPMVLIVIIGLFVAHLPVRASVLAYATEMSAQTLLTETNAERSKFNAGNLSLNDKLSKAAQAKAEDMAARDYWSHQTPEGKEPWIFVQAANYTYSKAGENLAYGFTTSDATINGWMNSPTHRENMLDNTFSEVGFGFVNSSNFNKDGEMTIVVAMYAAPATNTAPVAAAPNPDALNTLSSSPATAAPINVAQSVFGTIAPMTAFAVGLTIGISGLWLIVRHGRALKRSLHHGEDFVHKHPVLDVIIVTFVMTGYVFAQTSGFIL